MKILGIETSCDETGASVVSINSNGYGEVLSNGLASSLSLHAKTGGIIPEIAAREQIRYIIPTLTKALLPFGGTIEKAIQEIDAIAVTYGPGLIGSLLVGIETARTLAMLSKKPIIPVNHMYGHVYANWLVDDTNDLIHKPPITFPAIALVVSGGHTDLLLIKSHTDWKVIGGTRDDAAGEAFDKIGRLLHLPYPAGPRISELAEKGDPKAFKLPRPMWDSKDYDFSFSGLKTAVLTLIKNSEWEENIPITQLCDLAASVQQAICSVLVHKTLQAVKEYNARCLLLGGGVASNAQLREELRSALVTGHPECMLFYPEKKYCVDNGAMIAVAAFYQQQPLPWQEITANPQLYY